MYQGSVADSLFIELLVVALILLLQMLYNNLMVYRKKLNDTLSIMLIACLVMALFDHIQVRYDGIPGAYVINYAAAIGYAISIFVVSERLNLYFLENLEIRIRSRLVRFMIYDLPLILISLLLVTTPWTGLILRADENNVMEYMPGYFLVLFSYPISAMAIAVYMCITKYKTKKDVFRVSKSMLIFVLTLIGLYLLQESILISLPDNYLTLTIPIAVSLVLVTTDLSIFSLMKEEKENARIGADLDTARKIQMEALPVGHPAFPDHPDINLNAFIKTAKEVGGDFYDYFSPDEDHVCFLIADVSGKGIPAALFMMTVKTMIKDYAMTMTDTSEIFTAVNRHICEGNESGMFATAWIGMIDTRTMTLTYTNAGHNYPLISHDGRDYDIMKKKHGLFLAGMEDTVYRCDEVSLRPGDRLFLYTDGITEAHNVSGELYGVERLKDSLARLGSDLVPEDMEKIISDVDDFAGDEPQFDDMTIVMIEIKEKEKR